MVMSNKIALVAVRRRPGDVKSIGRLVNRNAATDQAVQ